MNIIEFIRDPKLIASALSAHQETALRLLYGLPLSKGQTAIARQALDTRAVPQKEFNEGTFICGRRSGKSDRLAANIAVYEAASGDHHKHLAAGERGHILLIAQDKRAARVLYGYIQAKLERSQLLSQLVQDIRKEEIELTNGLTISIFPCSFRAPRGFSVPVAILDEVAFFRVEGVNVDKEVIDAVRPAQATFPRPKLIKISTPYWKKGELYRDFASRHHRKDLLCFQAPSKRMNPSLSQSFLDREKARDSEVFDREYRARFSDRITTVFEREAVEACVVPGRYELPYSSGFRYLAGVDPAGGGPDEFALAICHQEGTKIVQDVIRARRTRRPADVAQESARLLKSYRIGVVTGDRYSSEWVRQAFRDQGIRYQVSKLTASDAFLELLPRINQGTIELLDDRVQTDQLIALERQTSRTGKDSLSHPQGGHDDRANALAQTFSRGDSRPRLTSLVWGDRLTDGPSIRVYRPFPAPPFVADPKK